MQISKQIKRNLFILFLLAVILFFSLVVNLLIPKHLILISGEHMFSFDYMGHFNNLYKNYLFDKVQRYNLSECQNCQSFYQISAWYMLWTFGLLSIGQVLGFYPMVFYFLLDLSIQFVFLYLFVRIIFGKISKISFFFAAFFFIASPHKIYLIPSSTLDGVIHGLLVGIITFWIYILKNLDRINYKRIIFLSLGLGFIFLFFLNIAIAHLPLAVYTILLLCIPFFKNKIYRMPAKFIVSIAIIFLFSTLLNAPIILSQISSGDLHYLTSFNPLLYKDALLGGLITAGTEERSINILIVIVIFLFFISKIHIKYKILLLLTYLSLAFLLTGGKIGQIYLYQFIFDHFPLMDHIRSLYRFISFEILIVFVCIYSGLKSLWDRGNFSKCLVLVIGLLIIYININYIINNQNLFYISTIPQEYFDSASYLKDKPDKKAYFPIDGILGNDSMSGNYNWLSEDKVRNKSAYSNPFDSLLMVSNQLIVDGYQLDSNQETQIRSLINYDNIKDSIEFLSSLGVKYLIVDKNYYWQKNFPKANLEDISKYAQLDKQFGNILIYNLQDKSKDCISAYGDFKIGYCYNEENPNFLINRTSSDFVLDKLERSKSPNKILGNNSVKLPRNIVNSDTVAEIINDKTFLPFSLYQSDNDKEDIYKTNLRGGSYKLLIPVLTESAVYENKIFQNEVIDIYINGELVQKIYPFSAYHGVTWKEVNLNINNDSIISIGTKGPGFIVLGDPLIFSEHEYEQIEESAKSISLRGISTYGPFLDNINFKINGNNLRNEDRYNAKIEVNLLTEYYSKDLLSNPFFKTYLDNSSDIVFPQFVSTGNKNIANNLIITNHNFNRLKFFIGSAFIDSSNTGYIQLVDKYGGLLYQADVYKSDAYINEIVVPSEIVKNLPKEFNIKLILNKKGVLLYRFVFNAEIR